MKLIDADVLLNNTDGMEHVKYSQEYGHVVLVCDIVYAPPVDFSELKQEFIRLACYIDDLLVCSDEQKETLNSFVSSLAKLMPWERVKDETEVNEND